MMTPTNSASSAVSVLRVKDQSSNILLDVPRGSWLIAGRPPIRELLRQLWRRMIGD